MDQDLVAYFADNSLLLQTSTAWDEGRMPLTVSYYLVDELPPTNYITSVRCVLFRKKAGEMQVMVVRDATENYHVIPGGRIKSGESLLDALHREVLEETGWAFSGSSLFCVARFHHLAAKPIDYHYPYPDFLQLIYRANAIDHDPDARQVGGYELETLFRSVDEVKHLLKDNSQQIILNTALELETPDDS